ncbi:PIH1 domain-containing protein 2-like [Diadema setosum]|uniref:PIH1 domain-containing protein 2-like n=1 Tax=Diadema setosum TaxID=31175 RepID=UPI003B3B9B63
MSANGEEGFGSSLTGDSLKQASHIWAMLDEMADSDPAAYSKFIKKTLEEGKKKVVLPKPFACFRTSLLKPEKTSLYINLCAWESIPKPKTDEEPVAVASGPIETEKDKDGEYKVVRLAFNPYVLEEGFKNAVDRDLIINLGIDYIQNQHKVTVSRSYRECSDFKFKGPMVSLTSTQRFFGKREKTEEEILQENLAGLSPQSLLGKVQELSGQDLEQSELESRLRGLALNTDSMDSMPKKAAGLIEEISSSDVDLPAPEYNLRLLPANENKQRRLELRLELTGVQSVSECELDISEEEVSLFVEGKYRLCLPLPEPIRESDAKAKFNKKSSALSVILPTQAVS